MFLTLRHKDGTCSTVPVNGASTLHVQTWRPPVFASEGATLPVLTEDQTFSLDGVVAVTLDDVAPDGAVVVEAPLEEFTAADAAVLDAQFETAPAPWEDD